MKTRNIFTLVLAILTLVSVLTVNVSAANTEDDTVAIIQYYDEIDQEYKQSEYTSLDSALASTYPGDTVYLIKSDSIHNILDPESGEIVSPEVETDVTLVIPTSANYEEDNTTEGHNGSGGIVAGSAYVTLTVPADVTLTVNGTLLVAGNQQSTTGNSGYLTGNYGEINLSGKIEVGSTGKLYARGVIEGTGSVDIASEGKVYERFEIADWRGGNASRNAFNVDVFPFNLYELGGIDTDLVVHAGASLFGQSYIYASTLGRGASIDVPYIGTVGAEGDYDVTGSVLTFKASDTDGTITLSKANGRTNVTIENAEIETGNISYTVRIFGIPIYDFSSAKTDCPFGYNMDVTVKNSTVDIRTKVKFLPGSSFTVDAGSTLTITESGAMYFYAANTYEARYCNTIPAGWDVKLPAILQVNGGTVINNGTLASSSLGETIDNIKGLGEITKGEEVTVNEVTQSGTNVTVVPVPFYKAVLPTTDPPPAE